MSFSQKVKALLKESGMTKAELAKDAGIAYTTLDSMLKRETDTARLATIFRIARALGTSVEALVFDKAEESPMSYEEERILKLYSLLDSRGKDTVLSLLEKEADNSREKEKKVTLFSAPAAAGDPLPVLSDEEESLSVLEGEVPEGTDFMIRLSGDSMEPLFSDGDLVYLKSCPALVSGEIGVFLLNGESLCKKFLKTEEGSFLCSLNPDYAPIPVLETDDLRLVGKVILCERKDEKR